MKNHIPMRRCIVCKNSKPKKELIRIVDRSSEIEIDYTGRANGRGAYICNNPECCVYAGLAREGAAVEYLDLGGGLAVDYLPKIGRASCRERV